jgi:putative IMPACT (imprinted ancient) family translation regulator
MLDVLRHQDLEGVLATVVRYYGGVKLGLAAWCGPTPTVSPRP